MDNNLQIRVFLGGTCNETTWRDKFISLISDGCTYFNPVVQDWTEDCYTRELKERENSDLVLYTITPRMTGTYSIAEVIDSSNKRPEATIFCFLTTDVDDNGKKIKFDDGDIRSLEKVAAMVKTNGGVAFTSLEEVAAYCDRQYKKKKSKMKKEESKPNTLFGYQIT